MLSVQYAIVLNLIRGTIASVEELVGHNGTST